MASEDGTDAAAVAPPPEEEAAGATSWIAGPTRAEIAEVNALIKLVVGPIEDGIKSVQPSVKTATSHVWVIDAGKGVTLRFTVDKEGDGRFSWLAEGKKSGDPDSVYQEVLGASFQRDAAIGAPGRGRGVIRLDIDGYSAIAAGTGAATAAVGKIRAGFRHGPKGDHHRYLLDDYSPDPSRKPRVSVYFDVVHVFAAAPAPGRVWIHGGGQADLGGATAALGSPADASQLERFHSRVRRLNGVGGWASAVAFSGNLPAGTAAFVRECWTAAGMVTYRRTWSCAYPSGLTNLAIINLRHSCTLASGPDASVGGAAQTDTTDDPLQPSNAVALEANCFVGQGTIRGDATTPSPPQEVAADFASETSASADGASLIRGSAGASPQSGPGALTGASDSAPTPLIINPGLPKGINHLCLTCPPPPVPALTSKAYTQHVGRLVGTSLTPIAPGGFNGVDSGIPFMANGKLIVLFGDASEPSGSPLPPFADPVAWSADVSAQPPNHGFARSVPQLCFYTGQSDTCAAQAPILPLSAPFLDTGCDNAPVDGFTLGSRTYVFYKSGWNDANNSCTTKCAKKSDCSPLQACVNNRCQSSSTLIPAHTKPTLTHTDLSNFNQPLALDYQLDFTARDQTSNADRFQNVSVQVDPANPKLLWIFGTQTFRQSAIYLAAADLSSRAAFESGRGSWSYYDATSPGGFGTNESAAAAIVQEDCVGELSVRYQPEIAQWLMLYNCGSSKAPSAPCTGGACIFLRSAPAPTGPWSDAITIFDPGVDASYFTFLHDANPPGTYVDDGLSSYTNEGTWGVAYGPYLIPEYFTTESPGVFSIYYTLQSWNPYLIHLMRTVLVQSGAGFTPPSPKGTPSPLQNQGFRNQLTNWTATGATSTIGVAPNNNGFMSCTTSASCPLDQTCLGGTCTVQMVTLAPGSSLSQSFAVGATGRALSFEAQGNGTGKEASVQLLSSTGEVLRQSWPVWSPQTNNTVLGARWTLDEFVGQPLTLVINNAGTTGTLSAWDILMQ